MSKKYWLMKSEPDSYSIEKLKLEGTTWWEGVRNYQARNFMAKDMAVGDEILFYHSSTAPAGVAGLAVVSMKAAPDQSQFDKKSDFYDPKASKEKPIWFCVQVKYTENFKNYVTLDSIRQDQKLQGMIVIKKGSRLSIQPVSEKDFKHILKLGRH